VAGHTVLDKAKQLIETNKALSQELDAVLAENSYLRGVLDNYVPTELNQPRIIH